VSRTLRIGVLALQGDFEAHRRALERAGACGVEVRAAAQLNDLDGLILPGGETTTMLKLLGDESLFEPLAEFGRRRPIFGTCAGAILLAAEVSNPPQPCLGLMDIGVERNSYGRQLDSHVARLEPEAAFARAAGPGEVEAVFIRAPRILRAGPGVEVYLRHRGDPVLVAQGPHLAATFHPELSDDPRIHRLFLERV
jgi:5'-phosphate synthase pdxT subunit